MTALHFDRAREATIGAVPAPADPIARYHGLVPLTGLWVVLISGDCAVEGRILRIARPDLHADEPAPLVSIDTGTGLVTGPVLPGDLIAAPPE